MADSVSQACAVVDALAAFQLDLLQRINKKFAALRSLARLVEQLADLASWIPNLALLVPVVNINLELYLQLRASCPFLNLPEVNNSDLNVLQNAVARAYGDLYRQIQRGPGIRLGKIQEQMDQFESDVVSSVLSATPFLNCLKAVCAAGQQARLALSRWTDSSIKKQIDEYTDNYLKNAGSVLSGPAKVKHQLAKDSLEQLAALGADINQDYADAKSKLSPSS